MQRRRNGAAGAGLFELFARVEHRGKGAADKHYRSKPICYGSKSVGDSEGMQNAECRIEIRGCTDLALDPRPSTLESALKFSGNAQRRKKHFLLFHGTFLL